MSPEWINKQIERMLKDKQTLLSVQALIKSLDLNTSGNIDVLNSLAQFEIENIDKNIEYIENQLKF